MGIHRFYTERKNLTVGSSVKLPDSEIVHIKHSLRLKVGDRIVLFNGAVAYEAELGIVSDEVIMATITSELGAEQSNLEVNLYQALIKPQNFEVVVQKATELGVSNIYPVNTEYSQLYVPLPPSKLNRWQKIALEASKQAERTVVPQVDQALDFKELEFAPSDTVWLLTLPRQTTLPVNHISNLVSEDQLAGYSKLNILVGPEGGFSKTEHDLALQRGWGLVSLGQDFILRAETAAIVALGIVGANLHR